MFSEAEIAAQLPVWEAISELWLDTVIEPSMLESAARTLAASPFSLDELHRIYLYEVAPAVHANLKAVGGEWIRFDREWLRDRIVRQAPRHGRIFRWWVDCGWGRWWMASDADAHWRIVVRHVAELRGLQPLPER